MKNKNIGLLVIFFILFQMFSLVLFVSAEEEYLYADQDAWVSEKNPTTNYEDYYELNAGNSSTYGNCEAYFLFDLSSIYTDYDSISFEFTTAGYVSSITFNIIITNTTWDEDEITWITKPEHEEVIDTITISSSKTYRVDLTDYIDEENMLSLCINMTYEFDDDYMSIYSKDTTSIDDYKPRLAYDSETSDFFLFLAIGITIGIAVFLIFVIAIVRTLMTNKHKKNATLTTSRPSPYRVSQPTPTQPAVQPTPTPEPQRQEELVKYCPYCGSNVEKDVKVCPYCGADVND